MNPADILLAIEIMRSGLDFINTVARGDMTDDAIAVEREKMIARAQYAVSVWEQGKTSDEANGGP